MSETKFTPGPWTYGNYTDFLEIQNTDPCNPKEVCYIDDWTDEQEAAANAALIAAAPSMYKLLEGLIPVIERFNSAVPLDPMAALSWIDYINDVLAKARGEKKDNE